MQEEDQTTVTVVIVPKEVLEAFADEAIPAEEQIPQPPEEVPPTSDVSGEDIPDVPRYPGSVRTSYMSMSFGHAGTMTTVSYITSASVDEVLEFYQRELPVNGWTETMKMRMEDTFTLVAYKEGASVQFQIWPCEFYPGYTSISLLVDREQE